MSNLSDSTPRLKFGVLKWVALVFVVGMAIAVLGPNVWNGKQSKKSLAKSQIILFRDALSQFRLKHERLPGTLDELVRVGLLNEDPVPADPWGNPYLYRSEDRTFYIASAGPDGIFENEDDIVYPELRHNG